MKTRYRKMIIFFWVACQVVAFSLLFPTHVYADDCLTDPLNAADCMRTGGFRTMIIVGVSIAGTLGAIASELATAAAKDPSKQDDVVYVLNPSTKTVDLQPNQPFQLVVNAYKVTAQGSQIETGATISLVMPPELGDSVTVQATGGGGQVTYMLSLVKTPPVPSGTARLTGVFPKGKKTADIQISFSSDFVIAAKSGDPRIFYSAKDKVWQVPALITYFSDRGANTPKRVSFQYYFQEPKLKFDPDIIDIVECFTVDQGLTYEFKLALRPNTNLEGYFGTDLATKEGKIQVNVEVVDDKQNKYPASMFVQLSPQLRMIAYSYGKDVKTRGRASPPPYESLVFDDMEFIADSIDKLPLVFFFIRSDKEVVKGAEAEAVLDIVDVQKFDWTTAASFEDPAVNSANTNGGFFAYDLSSSDSIAPDKDRVNRVYDLEVDARIRAGGPKNYTFEENYLRITVKPQFILLRLWVVPGHKRSTSEAIAYAKLLPSHKPFTGLPLTLETSGGGGATLNMSDGADKVTQKQDPPPGGSTHFKMVKGAARWVLTYSGLTWNSLSGAQFQITCKGPKGKIGEVATANDSFDVNANVMAMLSDLLSDPGIQAKMNNPYFNDSYLPYCLRGPMWNIYQKFDTNRPYVCHQMRADIIDHLQQRRNYRSEGDLKTRLASMRGMNGIEYEKYYVMMVHVWAGFFLSGNSSGDYKALDPWWEQRWNDPSFNKPENLMTTYGEAWNLSKMTAAAGVVATAAVSALAAAGTVVSVVSVATLIKGIILGLKLTAALEAAGLADVGFSSHFEYDSLAFDDGTLPFPKDWLTQFIPRLNQQDLNEWRKS